MEVLLIWFLFGIGCMMVAAHKGRSLFGWFILGVMFGPFGLLFSLLTSNLKNEAKKYNQMVPPAETMPEEPPVMPDK